MADTVVLTDLVMHQFDTDEQAAEHVSEIGENDLVFTDDTTQERLDALETKTEENKQEIDSLKETKQDIATAVNYNNITNCITHIPQDIKLELNNGTLTLKAGSKVYKPDGSSYTLDGLKTATQTTNDTRLYFYNGSYIEKFPVSQCYSGATAPSGNTYMFWLDTTNNVVKKTSDGGSTWESGWSLPFARVTATGGAISSIDQVFNGFGYIGSCVFTLPGVKGLYPNGRNEDGTLKNGLINCTTVQVSSNFNDTLEHTLMINPNGRCAWYSTTGWHYNDIANVMVASSGTVLTSATLGTFKTTNGVISNFNPHEAFHAVDYSEFEEFDNTVVHKTGNETIGGQKTLTSGTVWKKEDWSATQNPTSNKFATWSQVCDASYSMFSYVETSYLTDGTVQQSLGARKVINGTQYTANIRTRVDASGNTFVELGSNPASSSNGTQVATTYWANAKFLPLAGGTITGNIVTSGQNGYAFGNGAKIRNSGSTNANLTMFLKDGDWKQSYIGLESGVFAIYAGDGTNVSYLIGKSDGTLTWNDKNIALDANVLHKTGNETVTGVITTKSQFIFENASSSANRGFLYKTSDGALSMGISKSDNSGWQSYQSFITSGQYLMNVSDGTKSKLLSAKSDGTLTWDGKPIVRLVAEQKATADNNYTWYRKYSDGWVEQGGKQLRGGSSVGPFTAGSDTVNLPVAMVNEYYTVQLTSTSSQRYAYSGTQTTAYFKFGTADDSSSNNDGVISWYVCGYAAQ